MNIKKIQSAKILILIYCISLIALAVRDFNYIYVVNYPLFYFLFLIPLIIAIITILAIILKRKKKLFYAFLNTKEMNVPELLGIIVLEGAFIFGLILAFYGFPEGFNSDFLFPAVTIMSNLFFLVYISLWIFFRRKDKLQTRETIKQVAKIVKEKKKKIDFDSITELLGFSSEVSYTELDNGYIFEVPEEHIYADYFERIKVVYDEVFKGINLVLKLKSDSLLSLDIRKRDSIFSDKRNEFSISPLSSVYTLNSQTPEIWETLFSDPIFQQNLLLLRPYFEYFSLKGEYIEAQVYTDQAVVKLIDWIMELNPSMESISKNIDSAETEVLLCYNCQDPFDPLEETCNKCGSARPRCIICYQDLKPQEENDVVMLPCCGIYAHKDHIMKWLEKKSICPNCHSSLSRWMNQKRISGGF